MRFLIAACLFLLLSPEVYAACQSDETCTPGIPCHACLTQNDPDEPDDGPNAEDAPNASKSVGSNACNADFMNQIIGRAYIEAEREKMIGEVIMRKPDSVMVYTCFPQMVDLTARNTGDSYAEIFTESTYWNNQQVAISAGPAGEVSGDMPLSEGSGQIGLVDTDRPVNINTYMGADRMDQALEEVVLESLDNYLSANFTLTMPGGTLGVAVSDTTVPNVNEGDYNCAIMASIFQYTKCENIGDDDQFFSFEYLSNNSNDPRLYPEACGTGVFRHDEDDLQLANNADSAYVARDPIGEIYREHMMYPPNISWEDDLECSDIMPIPTGVMVNYKEFLVEEGTGETSITVYPAYKEHVCPNPTCYYVPDIGQGTGQCEDRKQVSQ